MSGTPASIYVINGWQSVTEDTKMNPTNGQQQTRVRNRPLRKRKSKQGDMESKVRVDSIAKPKYFYKFEYDSDNATTPAMVVPTLPGVKAEKSSPPLCLCMCVCVP